MEFLSFYYGIKMDAIYDFFDFELWFLATAGTPCAKATFSKQSIQTQFSGLHAA